MRSLQQAIPKTGPQRRAKPAVLGGARHSPPRDLEACFFFVMLWRVGLATAIAPAHPALLPFIAILSVSSGRLQSLAVVAVPSIQKAP